MTADDDDSYVDTVPESTGAQNTVIANGGEEVITASADLGIDIGADGWGDAQISSVPTLDDGYGDLTYVTGVAANGDSTRVSYTQLTLPTKRNS